MAGTADREQNAAEESNYTTILHALIALCRLSVDFGLLVIALSDSLTIFCTTRDRNGQERLDIVRDRTGTVFNLIATRGNGTGMDLSQRDGTGYDFHSRVPL